MHNYLVGGYMPVPNPEIVKTLGPFVIGCLECYCGIYGAGDLFHVKNMTARPGTVIMECQCPGAKQHERLRCNEIEEDGYFDADLTSESD